MAKKGKVSKVQLVVTPEQQELVNTTAEVFIRFYSDIYYEQKPNTIYLQAIQANIDEWTDDHDGDESVFAGAVIQTLCMTIINMLDREDEQ
jgi:hypothetical protein